MREVVAEANKTNASAHLCFHHESYVIALEPNAPSTSRVEAETKSPTEPGVATESKTPAQTKAEARPDGKADASSKSEAKTETEGNKPEAHKENTGSALAHMGKIRLSPGTPKADYNKDLPVVVVVDKAKHLTHAYQIHDQETSKPRLVEVLAIPDATGAPRSPTPSGHFKISQMQKNPTWYPPKSIPHAHIMPPSAHNPLGPRWIKLDYKGGAVGLHGTNAPGRIGQSVSHGCIRHRNNDITKLYDIVKIGTPVYIVENTGKAQLDANEFEKKKH